jgi:hypothetical protein
MRKAKEISPAHCSAAAERHEAPKGLNHGGFAKKKDEGEE